jgi:hypothetical protein
MKSHAGDVGGGLGWEKWSAHIDSRLHCAETGIDNTDDPVVAAVIIEDDRPVPSDSESALAGLEIGEDTVGRIIGLEAGKHEGVGKHIVEDGIPEVREAARRGGGGSAGTG